jgi:hypothetical protein
MLHVKYMRVFFCSHVHIDPSSTQSTDHWRHYTGHDSSPQTFLSLSSRVTPTPREVLDSVATFCSLLGMSVIPAEPCANTLNIGKPHGYETPPHDTPHYRGRYPSLLGATLTFYTVCVHDAVVDHELKERCGHDDDHVYSTGVCHGRSKEAEQYHCECQRTALECHSCTDPEDVQGVPLHQQSHGQCSTRNVLCRDTLVLTLYVTPRERHVHPVSHRCEWRWSFCFTFSVCLRGNGFIGEGLPFCHRYGSAPTRSHTPEDTIRPFYWRRQRVFSSRHSSTHTTLMVVR